MHSSGVFGVTGTESSDEKFNSNQNTVDPKLRKRMKAFVDNYLRVDGVFMIHMLTVNFGDVVTAEIVGLLWYSWIRCYSGHSEWNLLNDNTSDDEFNVDAVPKSNEQMSNGLPLTNSDLEVTKRLIEPPIAEHNFVNRAS
ncbi:unnamed protein product [Dicrocoelium dendriticum]|nr:unnamed protein product [Dicrocoelium dendriticum]